MNYNNIDQQICPALDYDTRLLISNFAILWNTYERFAFNKEYHPRDIEEKIINKIIYDDIFSKNIDTIFQEFKKYLKKRKIGLNAYSLWTNFGFNYKDKNQNQLSILNNIVKLTKKTDKLYLLLLIIGRVRNNMFHGIKVIRDLNMQKELFLIANKTLVLTLENLDCLYL